MKLLFQFLIAGAAVGHHYFIVGAETGELTIPFVKDFTLNLGLAYIPFAMLVIVGSSNAVNLTDGLDVV